MGGVPYKSTKDSDWALFQVFPHKHPCHVNLQQIHALEHAMEPPVASSSSRDGTLINICSNLW